MTQRTGAVLLLWTLLAAVLAMNIYRAVTQSFTIDEAFTYTDFVAAPWEEARHHIDPNNHVLNTLLAKVSVAWWGPSEWAVRMPSLTGGALYLFSALGLTILIFGTTWISVVIFAALILNPIVLDYMSAARGYSLAIGLQFFALLLMVRLFLKAIGKFAGVCLHLTIGIALGLSAVANLTFLIPNAILVAAYLVIPWMLKRNVDSEQLGIHAGLILAAAGITFSELMFGLFEGANISTFTLGEASAIQSLHTFFRRSLQVPTVPGGSLLPPLLAVVTGPMLIVCLGVVIFYCLRKRGQSADAVLLFPLTLLGSAAALVALHWGVGLPYPYERTGIYFLPFATFTVAAASTVSWKIVSRAAWFCLCAIVLQYALELKTGWYEEWRFDAGTKRVVQALIREHGVNKPVKMGVSWFYEPTANYYLQAWHLDWLAPVTRDDPKLGVYDYYYLAPQDQAMIAQQRLVIIYRDPVSNAILAKPPQ